MKTKSTLLLSALVLGAGLFVVTSARAESGCACCSKAGLTAVAATGSFDLAKAKASYPLDTCVVSGDKLEGGMGGPVDYVYKEDGKTDRLVRFCCKSCIKKFNKEPAKYLKMIDDAAATQKGMAPQLK